MNNEKEKLLCLSIDSEHYTDLCVDLVKDVDDAVKTLLERESNCGDGLSVAVSKDGCKTRITLSDGNPYDEYFVVAEVFTVPADMKYCVAWWHGYDGVGFDLKGTAKTKLDAVDMLHFYVTNYWEDYDLDDYCEGDCHQIVDTGNEWEGIELIDLDPSEEAKEVA